MKAIIVKNPGGIDQLELVDMPPPQPMAGELLINVHAAAINRADIATREGKSKYLQSPVLGVEVAGTVVEINGHSAFAVGDRVMGLVNGGGYAEYAVMPTDRAMRIPSLFSFEEAAAIPEVFLTAYQTLFWIGKLQKNETVLIHAAASGVGTAAIQMAKQICNANVIVTAGSKQKLDVCRSLGADVLIDYKKQSFDEEVLRATGNHGADLILDFIGASYWEKNLTSIAKEGRWVLIGALGGVFVEKVNLFRLMSKYVQLNGTLLTPRSDEYKAALTKDFSQEIFPFFERRAIQPIVDRVFPLALVGEAHQYMEENQNTGKIVLKLKG